MSLPSTAGLLVGTDRPLDVQSARADLVLASLLLRDGSLPWPQLVRVHVPSRPTVAFTARDARSPHLASATAVARELGFETVVRSPGGRMVAYDAGAVVIDHVGRGGGLPAASRFADNARAHAAVLRSLTDADVRVGEVEGEYCPGEFSINLGGTVKIVGSAQRIAGGAWLFSTVVQVAMSEAVRRAIVAVSAALEYRLVAETIAGLSDHDPAVSTEVVAAALREDYRRRGHFEDGELPPRLVTTALAARRAAVSALPFRVDDWARAALVEDAARNH